MKTIMKLEQLNNIEDIKRFLNGTDIVAFNVVTTKQEGYQWVHKALRKHRYRKLSKLDKGTVAQYLMKVTAYSRSQIKRLVQQFVKTSDIKIKVARRNGFICRYTPSNIRLLAEMDERHQQPSGAVIKKLCERAYQKFEQDQYQNLANILV
jgi:exosome complex RNA-binding protein Rrp4